VPPAERLRERARAALQLGGLPFDEKAHSAYLELRFGVAKQYATNLQQRLEATARPESDVERSIVASVPTMAAFAFTIADCAYQIASIRSRHREDVRAALAAYVIGSAIFDYACDEDHQLLLLFGDELSAGRLRGILETEPSDVEKVADGPPLLRYFWLLFADFVASFNRLGAPRPPIVIRSLRQQVVQGLIESYQAEIASITSSSADRRETTWSSPLLMAYLLMQLSSDASAQINRQLENAVRQVGRLLALVDDVTDIEDDWTSNSRNELLIGLRAHPKNGDRISHWEAVLSDECSEPHMVQITALAAACAESPWAKDLTAWLYYWLYA
jgi:hypothetical protein